MNTGANKILSNAARVSGGTGAGQLLVLLGTPILTRFYAPEAFGTMALFMAVVGVLTVLGTLQFERAVNVPKEDATALALIQLTLGIGLVFALVIAAASFGLAAWRPQVLAGLAAIWYLIPIGLIAALSLQVGSFWVTRLGQFKRLAAARFLQSFVLIATQLAGILILPDSLLLILGVIAGWLVAGSILLHSALAYRLSHRREPLPTLLGVASKYADFARMTTPSMVLHAAARELPVFVLSLAFSKEIVGYYALAYRMLWLPLALLGKAVEQSLLHAAAQEYKAEGSVSRTTSFILKSLISLSVLTFTALALAAPTLFPIVFGPNWHMAGVFVSSLAPLAAVIFISAPATSLFSLLERQALQLRLTVLTAALCTLALLSAFVIPNPALVILLYSLGGAAGHGLTLASLMQVTKVSAATVLRSLKLDFLIAGALALLIASTRLYLPETLWVIASLAVLAVLAIIVLRIKQAVWAR